MTPLDEAQNNSFCTQLGVFVHPVFGLATEGLMFTAKSLESEDLYSGLRAAGR